MSNKPIQTAMAGSPEGLRAIKAVHAHWDELQNFTPARRAFYQQRGGITLSFAVQLAMQPPKAVSNHAHGECHG